MADRARQDILGRRWGRRSVLKGGLAGAAGLTGAALIGCGADEESPSNGDTTPGAGGTSPAGTAAEGDRPFPYNFPEPDTEPKAGGTLRVAGTWDTATWDTTTTAAGGTIVVPGMTCDRLVQIKAGPEVDPLGEVIVDPDLAESWEISDDGLTYTFHLHPGIKFQNVPPLDGRDFVAEDVKYAYERYASTGVHQPYFEPVESFEAVDNQTLRITLKHPFPDFLIPLGSRYLTIFAPELVEAGENETKSIGTGPMILKEARAGDRVVLEKNPDYWERDVLLDGVTFRIMPDANSRLAALRAEQVEYAYSPADTLRDAEALLGTNPDLQVHMTPPSNATFTIALNLDDSRFQDERVRRALSLTVDRQAWEQVLYQGLAQTLPTIPWIYIFDGPPTYEQSSPWWRFDPDEAQSLLSAAGAEGLSFEMIYFEYSVTGNTRMDEMIVDQMRQAGIQVRAQSLDYTTFNSQWVGRQFAEAADGWQTLGFEPDNYFYKHLHSTSEGNRWRIKDPQIDEWAEQQRTETDPEARTEIHHQIFERVMDQVYRIEKTTGEGFQYYQPWVRNLRFGGPLGSNSSYYEWGQQVDRVWLDQ